MVESARPMYNVETRTWDQRFGERCFCGASWGDPRPCGDSRAEYTIRDALGALFADRKGGTCKLCERDIAPNYTYCYDCNAIKAKYKQSQDRHVKVVKGTCERPSCNNDVVGRKAKPQRYCSPHCAQMARWGK